MDVVVNAFAEGEGLVVCIVDAARTCAGRAAVEQVVAAESQMLSEAGQRDRDILVRLKQQRAAHVGQSFVVGSANDALDRCRLHRPAHRRGEIDGKRIEGDVIDPAAAVGVGGHYT